MFRHAYLTVLIVSALIALISPASALEKLQVTEFKVPPTKETLEFYNVDSVAIQNPSVQVDPKRDFIYDKSQLCVLTHKILKEVLTTKDVSIYGCGEAVPKEEEGTTLYITPHIRSGGRNPYQLKTSLEWPSYVTIHISKFRLNPRRGEPPVGTDILVIPENVHTMPTFDERLWGLFNLWFERIYRAELSNGLHNIKYQTDTEEK